MADTETRTETPTETPNWRGRLGRLGEDWWATLLAGVIVALAVAGALPKIPW